MGGRGGSSRLSPTQHEPALRVLGKISCALGFSRITRFHFIFRQNLQGPHVNSMKFTITLNNFRFSTVITDWKKRFIIENMRKVTCVSDGCSYNACSLRQDDGEDK